MHDMFLSYVLGDKIRKSYSETIYHHIYIWYLKANKGLKRKSSG